MLARPRIAPFATLVFALFAGNPSAQDPPPAGETSSEKTKTEDPWQLEKIFPKDPIFGPSARSIAYAHDGKLAGYLYREREHRRHGDDLWLFDVAKGTARRLTSAETFAPFQESARKVLAARAKENAAAEKAAQEGKAAQKKDEGDDEKGPRYSGVSSFQWSPVAHELLVASEGDLYRLRPGDPQAPLERLTATNGAIRGFQWLPDGSGYTYGAGDALMKVTFGSHLVQQLDPKLPSGEEFSGYELSPDGKRLAFLTRTGRSWREGGRTVKIAQYRERFMDVREVPRQVSDDPMPKSTTRVYLIDLEGALAERTKPVRVFTFEVEGPRDVLQEPRWSADGKRVAFAAFEQKTSQVAIYVAEVPAAAEASEESGKEKAAEKPKAVPGARGEDGKDEIREVPAKLVHRFTHHGGPNTPRMIRPEFLADGRRIVFLTELSGFRHLHVLDPAYEALRQVTQGYYEVYPVGLSKDRRTMVVTTTQGRPACEGVYAVDLESGALRSLATEDGVFSDVAVSPDGRHLLGNFVRYGRLEELVAVNVQDGTMQTVTDSHPPFAREITKPRPEFFSYENRHGQVIHGLVFHPEGFDPKKDRRPLLVYVYGGPLGTRKNVVEGSYNSAVYMFAYYMTHRHGWVTCTIDPRGMSGYGAIFEKASFEQVGRPQTEDLVDGVKHLVAQGGIDPQKVGIHGWSFGGFQTQMCLYTEPDVFQVGIAGAGPTEWENYNAWYSTGTIGESRPGHPDLKKYSLLPLAKNLKGKLLLIHGMEDPNVLYQDTVRVYRELLQAGKETLVELFLDPTGGHGLGGDVKTLNRYRKYEDFLVRNLGRVEAPPATSPFPAPEKPAAGATADAVKTGEAPR